MFKIYILKKRKGGSEVLKHTKTDTPIKAVAEAAFMTLRNDTDYQGQNLLLLATRNGQQVAAHWFNRQPGDEEYVSHDQKLDFTNT